MWTIEKLSEAQLMALTEAHIVKYSKRISVAPKVRAVNVPETTMYLHIWERIKEKKGKGLSRSEQVEIVDALMSGDYDDLLEALE